MFEFDPLLNDVQISQRGPYDGQPRYDNRYYGGRRDCYQAFQRGYNQGFTQGYRQGYRQGIRQCDRRVY